MAKKILLTTLLACIALLAFSQGAEFKHKANMVEVSASLTNYKVATDSDGYTTFEAAGWIERNRIYGAPDLPIATYILSLPKEASYEISTIEQTSWTKALTAPIKPSLGPNIKDHDPLPVSPLKEYYSDIQPTSPVCIEELGILGNEKLLKVVVKPVQYLPSSNSLLIYSFISARIAIQTDSTSQYLTQECARYVIVTPGIFLEAIQPFAEWKRQEGYEVHTILAETTSANSIKDMLQNLYNQTNPLTAPLKYILIVGDVNQIGTLFGRHNLPGDDRHHTDLYYGEFTGDYLPEVMVGRLSVTSVDELNEVLAKILSYEQLNIIEPEYLNRALVVAGKEERQPAYTSTNGQVDYVSRAMAQNSIDTLCYYNPSSADHRDEIIGHISNGAGIVNYTAHCYFNAWVNPTLTVAQTDTLTTERPGIYINNCCSSNNFYTTCLGEALLRKPQGGAVAVIGASELTLWEEDYYWSVGAKYPLSEHPSYSSSQLGAFDAMTLGNTTLGEVLMAGNRAVTQSGSPYDAVYWEAYNLLGDPAMRPWLGTIPNLNLTHEDTALTGCSQLTVRGTPGARVTLIQNHNLMATSVIAPDSTAILHIGMGLRQGRATITATKPNFRHVADTLTVVANPTAILAIDSLSANDTSVTIRLRNVGTRPAIGHSISLEQNSNDSLTGNIAIPVTTILTSLEPETDTTIELPLQLSCTDSKWTTASVVLADSAGHPYASAPIAAISTFQVPDMRLVILTTNGDTCHRLMPDSTYLIDLRNNGTIGSVTLQTSTGIDTTIYDPTATLRTIIPRNARYLYIKVVLRSGRHTWCDSMWFYTGSPIEDFESGTLSSYPWQSPTPYPWQPSATGNDHNRFTASSGSIANRQTSVLQIAIDVMRADSIAFRHRTSCQQGDALQFMIDGVQVGKWGGDTPWQRSSHPISEGRHSLTWRYIKDESGSAFDDCVWIDDVEWPLIAWHQPCDTTQGFTIAVPETAASGRWLLWPNPTTGIINISVPEKCTMRLLDPTGHTIDTKKIEKTDTPTQYFTHHLRCGIYIAVFSTESTTVIRKIAIAR
ncbi:MAG: hypothetical protein K5650_04200 [Bacteroidales bacterium]|nr:hypothetical protein [Bacteroidales bacterium]